MEIEYKRLTDSEPLCRSDRGTDQRRHAPAKRLQQDRLAVVDV